MLAQKKKSTARDMTQGSIAKQIILFALPLMLGNVFQMLYNTVDSIIVGNFVGTQALAAVGSTTMITNMAVFFFNGFSIGAGVIIGKAFGAKDQDQLHTAIETTIAATIMFSILFTIAGMAAVRQLLNFMATPADVFPEATTYLRIYFAGIAGLLIYNMGSGILRAVGDTTRPLYFLILTSLMNIVLDLFCVVVLHMGIAGVAIATIISQFVSAVLVMMLLIRTEDVYKLTIPDLRINFAVLKQILAVGLPAAIQSCLTSFSNIFVQSYINFFGSSVMAGWASYNKIDSFLFLPINSMGQAATTFVSQNLGAKQLERAEKGVLTSGMIAMGVTVITATLIFIGAPATVRLFSSDTAVIAAGSLFLRTNVYFILFSAINNVVAGALRGSGDSKGPMIIMLTGFVVVRQTYLFFITRFVANTARIVGFGYPVGWATAGILHLIYYMATRKKRNEQALQYN